MASMNSVSRRNALKKAAAALGAGAAGLLGESATAQARPGAQAPAILTGTQAGRKYRAFMTFENAPGTSIQAARSSLETVTMKPLDEDRIVVRTEAAQVCYTIVGQVVGNYKPPQILGHSAVGIVEAIGSRVRRVQVGDRVILANTPQCGVCYNCLRGRADRCINTTQAPARHDRHAVGRHRSPPATRPRRVRRAGDRDRGVRYPDLPQRVAARALDARLQRCVRIGHDTRRRAGDGRG